MVSTFNRLGDTEVFDLIRKRKLHASLLDNIQYLMKLGEKVSVLMIIIIIDNVFL